jgi:nitroreductase
MTDFLELCRSRYSLRRFADKPVEKEKILRCLEAARLAPSASNGQPCRFVVFDDPARKQELCYAVFTGVYAHSRLFTQAPVIVALLIKSTLPVAIGGRVRGINFHVLDAGIAGEHFALAAAEQGLGTCWIGWFEPSGLMKLLKLKGRGYSADALLALGYPPSNYVTPEKKRRPVEEILSWNQGPK